MDEYTLYFDGCSKGNPGLSGAGAVIYLNNDELWYDSKFISKNQTNNYAEYSGLVLGLKEAVKLKIKRLNVKGDSLLVIKQMQGKYKVNSPNIIPLFDEAKKLSGNFDFIQFAHVYREHNKRADELSNLALQKSHQ
jgi:ribonuclease HI